MAFLTITGYGTVEVGSEAAAEDPPELGGEDTRAHAGNMRSVASWVKRSWSFDTGWLTQAEYNALKAAVANSAHVACGGDALDNAAVVCRVRVEGGPYFDEAGVGFRRIARLKLIEV